MFIFPLITTNTFPNKPFMAMSPRREASLIIPGIINKRRHRKLIVKEE